MKKTILALSAVLLLGAGTAFAEDQVPPSQSYMDSIVRADQAQAEDFRRPPAPRGDHHFMTPEERKAAYDRGEAPKDFRRPPAPRHGERPEFRHHKKDHPEFRHHKKDRKEFREHKDRDDRDCDGPRRHERRDHHDDD